MFHTKVVEKIKTQNFFYECWAVYEIMWKKNVETDRPQMTIQRMRTACWIPNATNTHSKYGILLAFSLQKWFTLLLRYMYISCFVGTEVGLYTKASEKRIWNQMA
jgi:hypothetical protein